LKVLAGYGTQPIFTAGRLKSNVRFERADQELALAVYQQTIQTAFREVSDVLIAYRKVKEVASSRNYLKQRFDTVGVCGSNPHAPTSPLK
jgi:outer membrane protein TolC